MPIIAIKTNPYQGLKQSMKMMKIALVKIAIKTNPYQGLKLIFAQPVTEQT